ncbi:MAG: hypothetical protein JJU11_01640 [Candidatus Sumerlaeia bacterium]|nr:hypothetical protein [Candidatus Sumerlaeia bacterium]
MGLKIAYLGDGELKILEEGGEAQKLHSPFAQNVLDTAKEIAKGKEWKTEGRENNLEAAMLWGGGPGNPNPEISISAVTRGLEPGEITYVLHTTETGGVFRQILEEKYERRLFHKRGFRANYIDRHPETKLMVFSRFTGDGSSAIVAIDDGGVDHKEVTEGDSVDEAPSWVPGEIADIVYQSRGIARARQGRHIVDYGPSSIIRLNLQTGETETLLDDDSTDYMLPHVLEDGSLLFIRRPYKSLQGKTDPKTFIMDVLLFPFRTAWALIMFLDSFSRFFGGKPLITSTGKRVEREEEAMTVIRGAMINMKQAPAISAVEEDTKGYMPANYELVQKKPDGTEKILARHVASYDVAGDGTIVYTNGRTIFRYREGSRPATIIRESLVQELVTL